MGINGSIYEGVKQYADEYGFVPINVEEFLADNVDFSTRQDQAISIIEEIITAHGKQQLIGHLVQLAKVERDISELQHWQRDHVVHALLSFLLGTFINERFLKPDGCGVDPSQWKIACLFHDIGYPVEISTKVKKPFFDRINEIKQKLSNSSSDKFVPVVPADINKLTNDVNGLDLIQKWLDIWGLNINAINEYKGMVESGHICHGIISSLTVLYVIDLMYQKNNPHRVELNDYGTIDISWSQSCFENKIVPACAAIFIHNLDERYFREAKLDRSRAALPFLLRLSDCLQDWDRPSSKNKKGFSAEGYDIKVEPGKVLFVVANRNRRSKLSKDIDAAIIAVEIALSDGEILRQKNRNA